jgi:hypothetical protein
MFLKFQAVSAPSFTLSCADLNGRNVIKWGAREKQVPVYCAFQNKKKERKKEKK